MANKSSKEIKKIMQLVRNYLVNNSSQDKLVPIKSTTSKKATSKENTKTHSNNLYSAEAQGARMNTPSIESKLVPIKDRNDKSKLVSIKDRNDESELVPIANKNGTPSVSVNKGVATVHNGKNNYYTLDLNKLSFIKDKSKKPNITQVNDGIATIKDDKGNLHDVRMTLKK